MSAINNKKTNLIKKLSIAIIVMAVISIISTLVFVLIVASIDGFRAVFNIKITKSIALLMYVVYLAGSGIFFFVMGIVQLVKCNELPLAKKTIVISGILSIAGAFLMWVPILGWALAGWIIVLNTWILGEKELMIKPKVGVKEKPEV